MKLTQIKEFAMKAAYLLDKHSPVILTGVAVATGITAVILTTKATIKATRVVDAINRQKEEDEEPKMTKWEVVKEVAPNYIPAALTLTVSVTCMVTSTAILTKRNAALMGMCALATTQLKEHQDKVEELFGKKKAQEVRVAVEEDKMKREDTRPIIVTGGGDVLCRDCLSGQMFRSSVEKIHYAINAANEELLNCGYISLNDVYYLIGGGLEQSMLGEEQGWRLENGFIYVDFDSALSPANEPVLLLRFKSLPMYHYE